MRKLFENFARKMQRFMVGRYGTDELNRFLTILIFVLAMLTFIPPIRKIYIVEVIIMCWTLFRSFSKNISGRQKENRIYLNLKYKINGFFSFTVKRIRDREHRYFKCGKCGAFMRVPREKGKIEITCPKCGNKIIRKT